jgi:hypothetical protein
LTRSRGQPNCSLDRHPACHDPLPSERPSRSQRRSAGVSGSERVLRPRQCRTACFEGRPTLCASLGIAEPTCHGMSRHLFTRALAQPRRSRRRVALGTHRSEDLCSSPSHQERDRTQPHPNRWRERGQRRVPPEPRRTRACPTSPPTTTQSSRAHSAGRSVKPKTPAARARSGVRS